MKQSDNPKPASGWLQITNETEKPFWVTIEPWAEEYQLQPGSTCDLYLQESKGERPTVIYYEDGIQIYATYSALVVDGVEICNYSDRQGAKER